MIDPYENILIGNFLYSIGLLLGSKPGGLQLPASVNLLPQTPLDGPIGDAYLRFPGVIRIFEFKRESNRSTKEKTKLASLKAALSTPGFKDLEAVSRAIHWYFVSGERGLTWETNVSPYLEMEALLLEGQREPGSTDLRSFCERMAKQVLDIQKDEFPEADIQRYMEALVQYAGKSGTSSSGLIVMLSKEGGLQWLPLENFQDLRLSLLQLKDMTRQSAASVQAEVNAEVRREELRVADREQQRQQEAQQELVRERGKGRTPGQERG